MGVFTTASNTWAVGNKITAALLNGQLRDLINGFGAMTAYAPSWTAATTNPAIGNGTIVGGYTQVNKTIDWRVAITMGTTTTFGTGTWYISLPVAASTAYAVANMPVANWVGTPAAARTNGVVCVDTVTTRAFFLLGGSATVVSPTTPGAWAAASTNVLFLSGRYEAA